MEALRKNTEYFKKWDGEEQNNTRVKFSTQDLRDLASMNHEISRLNRELNCHKAITEYLANKHPDIYGNLLDEMAMDR